MPIGGIASERVCAFSLRSRLVFIFAVLFYEYLSALLYTFIILPEGDLTKAKKAL